MTWKITNTLTYSIYFMVHRTIEICNLDTTKTLLKIIASTS